MLMETITGTSKELLKCAVQGLTDGIFIIEAYPGAWKSTAIAAIAAFLVLVGPNLKITVIAIQHAALDAFNINITRRLKTAVNGTDKENGIHFPLVMRGFSTLYTDIADFVRTVSSKYKARPDPSRPNTLYALKSGAQSPSFDPIRPGFPNLTFS